MMTQFYPIYQVFLQTFPQLRLIQFAQECYGGYFFSDALKDSHLTYVSWEKTHVILSVALLFYLYKAVTSSVTFLYWSLAT